MELCSHCCRWQTRYKCYCKSKYRNENELPDLTKHDIFQKFDIQMSAVPKIVWMDESFARQRVRQVQKIRQRWRKWNATRWAAARWKKYQRQLGARVTKYNCVESSDCIARCNTHKNNWRHKSCLDQTSDKDQWIVYSHIALRDNEIGTEEWDLLELSKSKRTRFWHGYPNNKRKGRLHPFSHPRFEFGNRHWLIFIYTS